MYKEIRIIITDETVMPHKVVDPDKIHELLNALNEENYFKLSSITEYLNAKYGISVIVSNIEAQKECASNETYKPNELAKVQQTYGAGIGRQR